MMILSDVSDLFDSADHYDAKEKSDVNFDASMGARPERDEEG